jgi:hypothetical protein
LAVLPASTLARKPATIGWPVLFGALPGISPTWLLTGSPSSHVSTRGRNSVKTLKRRRVYTYSAKRQQSREEFAALAGQRR